MSMSMVSFLLMLTLGFGRDAAAYSMNFMRKLFPLWLRYIRVSMTSMASLRTGLAVKSSSLLMNYTGVLWNSSMSWSVMSIIGSMC